MDADSLAKKRDSQYSGKETVRDSGRDDSDSSVPSSYIFTIFESIKSRLIHTFFQGTKKL